MSYNLTRLANDVNNYDSIIANIDSELKFKTNNDKFSYLAKYYNKKGYFNPDEINIVNSDFFDVAIFNFGINICAIKEYIHSNINTSGETLDNFWIGINNKIMFYIQKNYHLLVHVEH